jgi:hypothetical protein
VTLSTPLAAFELTSVLAMAAVIVRNFRQVKEPDQRRRIQWIIYGSIVGITPGVLHLIIVLLFSLGLLGGSQNAVALFNVTAVIANLMTVVIPITIGYAAETSRFRRAGGHSPRPSIPVRQADAARRARAPHRRISLDGHR